ncbi:MAG: hypothetical protein K6360_07720 [Deltaproteobacteria bacterium]
MSLSKGMGRPAVFPAFEEGLGREKGRGEKAATCFDRDFRPLSPHVLAGFGLCGQGGRKDPSMDLNREEGDASSPGIPLEKDERDIRLEEALREADRILEEARRKADEIENEAYERGFAQGRKDGEEMGRRQYEARAEHLDRVVEGIRKAGEGLAARYEVEIVRLALTAAKAVVLREISIDPDVVITAVQAALAEITAGSPVTLHLSPSDADRVRDAMAIKGESAPGGHPITILPDVSVEPGGCFAETPFGSIDATMEGRWRVISDDILRVMAERLAGPASGLVWDQNRAGGVGKAK